MYTFLIFLEIIICIFLTIAILMQNSKGGGLAGTFGGGNIGSVFGVRRTADFLIKATSYLAGAFIVIALLTNIFFLPGKGKTTRPSVIQSGQSAVPPASVPQQAPAQQGQQ
ncbi:MAG: preprotein translocase subunit SecG [Acidobacteriota bacterium]